MSYWTYLAGCPSPTTALAILLAVLVTGCASRPEGVLAPVANITTDTAKIDLLVATTREPTKESGDFFTGERGANPSLANVVVSMPPSREIGTIQCPSRTPGDPERDFVTTAVDPMDREDLQPWFRAHSVKGRRVVIFVHGFNTRFDDSVFRFAQIIHDSRADVAPILFSWPSRGSIFDYNFDRESTNFSRSDLVYVIRQAVRSRDVSEITIMAHSMGCWLAVEALRDISLQIGEISPKITAVILASPDLDIDVFRKQMTEIGPTRPQFTIFVSANDRALRLSRLISGSVTRVGGVDLDMKQYQERIASIGGITVLDLTALRNGDTLSHSQFATSPEVVRLLGDRLIEGQIISDADVGTPDEFSAAAVGAGEAIGTVAGAALTAPIRIFQSASPP